MSTEKPRSPLDTAAMRICRLANAGNDAARVDFDRYWDLALTPMARSVYRQTALEVFGELARDPATDLREGYDQPGVIR
jgi:hypothetical protein